MENCASYSLSSTNSGDVEESHDTLELLFNLCHLLSNPSLKYLNEPQLTHLTKRIQSYTSYHEYKTHHKHDCLKNPCEYYTAI